MGQLFWHSKDWKYCQFCGLLDLRGSNPGAEAMTFLEPHYLKAKSTEPKMPEEAYWLMEAHQTISNRALQLIAIELEPYGVPGDLLTCKFTINGKLYLTVTLLR
jgi:hypothetical protein